MHNPKSLYSNFQYHVAELLKKCLKNVEKLSRRLHVSETAGLDASFFVFLDMALGLMCIVFKIFYSDILFIQQNAVDSLLQCILI